MAVAKITCMEKTALLEGGKEEEKSSLGRWCVRCAGKTRTNRIQERTVVAEIMDSAYFGSF